jgi:hemolysin activation/secretion protein
LNTYQFRTVAYAAHYFPTGKQGTVKTALHAGLLQSGNYFLNELYQIGGYKLLRGFTEESEYVSQYAVGTVEYRYLFGTNSNFFVFSDGGWAKNPLANNSAHTYISGGLGMSFETKAGIFNLAWAVGKRDDVAFNLRQSKIHFGFVNYF